MKKCAHLHPFSLGLAIGLLWGLCLLLIGFFAIWSTGWGVDFIKTIGSVYWGYDVTYLGSFFGLLWGFVDGFVGGVIFVWLYNFFCRCCSHHTCESCKSSEGE